MSFYALRLGDKPGIYMTIDEFLCAVGSCVTPAYGVFTSEHDADLYLAGKSVTPAICTTVPLVFVGGATDVSKGAVGYAVDIYAAGGVYERFSGVYANRAWLSLTNEGGYILGLLRGLKWCLCNNESDILIRSDMRVLSGDGDLNSPFAYLRRYAKELKESYSFINRTFQFITPKSVFFTYQENVRVEAVRCLHAYQVV